MKNSITVYGAFTYDRGAKTRWLLTELGVKYENKMLDLEKKELESEAYLAVNPLGRIPALKIDGNTMFESGAMCAYLADANLDAAKPLAPTLNSPERMEYQQWMHLASATIDPFVSRIMIIEDIPAGELLDKKTTALISEVTDVAGVLNTVLSKHEYLLKSGFSAADICVGYHLFFCSLWPEFKVIFDAQPHLASYLKRLQERPAAVETGAFAFQG